MGARFPMRFRRLAIPLLGAAALCALWSAPAEASPTQRSIVQDEARLLKKGAKVRRDTLDEIKSLGAEIVKVTVNWREIAPAGARKPAGFNGDDPGEYALSAWAPYDALARDARERGLEVFFLLGARAPDWAVQKRSQGSYRPNPVEFERFVRAVGKRYAGSYADERELQSPPPEAPPPSDGGGGGSPPPQQCPAQPPYPPGCEPIPASAASQPGDALPRVTMWSIWNEPNLSGWLAPQWKNRRLPISPHIYRTLYLAGQTALAGTGHGGDTILFGNLLPFARSGKTFPGKVRPLEFLREATCLDPSYRPFRGRAARVRGCSGFKPIRTSGIAYHPYTLAGGLLVNSAPSPDEASIDTLSKLTKALDKIGKRRRFSTRRPPVYLSEFGWQTRPPDPFATSLRLVPEFIGQSEWLAFRNPRVKAIAQYPLVDDAVDRSGFRRFSGFQSGLRYSNGKEKPRVYDAWRLPFFVRLLAPNKVEIFGGNRAATGGRVTVQSKLGGGFQPLPGGTLQLNSRGYFRRVFTISAANRRQYRFVSGSLESRVAKATVRPQFADGEKPKARPRHERDKRRVGRRPRQES
jgi:hypothetical protein